MKNGQIEQFFCGNCHSLTPVWRARCIHCQSRLADIVPVRPPLKRLSGAAPSHSEESPAPPDRVAVLAISSKPEDHVSLRGIFGRTRWRLHGAPDCREALKFLQRNAVGVLICDASLPDGSWKELLDGVSGLPESPLLIVASGNADDSLWTDALNLGAYDVLSKPFERAEVTRIVSLAWLHWKDQAASTAERTVGAATGVNGGGDR